MLFLWVSGWVFSSVATRLSTPVALFVTRVVLYLAWGGLAIVDD